MNIHLLLAALLAPALHAQTTSIPGVPEPGITIWGSVTRVSDGAPVKITSASWTLTDNAAVPTSMTMTSTPPAGVVPKPRVRIVTSAGTTFYVMQVPFDTRQVGAGTGAVTLADPNLQSDTASRYPSFPLQAAFGAVYTMTPVINGAPATVEKVDGAPAGTPSHVAGGFALFERARTVRVDLSIAQSADPFEVWATGFFGSASGNGARTADPDGDGQTNEAEFLAGTIPNNGASAFRVLTLTRPAAGGNITLNWATVGQKRYQIETSPDMLTGPVVWTPLGAVVTESAPAGTAASEQVLIPTTTGERRRLYRVRVLP